MKKFRLTLTHHYLEFHVRPDGEIILLERVSSGMAVTRILPEQVDKAILALTRIRHEAMKNFWETHNKTHKDIE